jgi:hypothetical protein
MLGTVYVRIVLADAEVGKGRGMAIANHTMASAGSKAAGDHLGTGEA